MKRRTLLQYTDSQKVLMWERWRQGESLHQIARLFDRHHSSVRGILAESGGIRPPARRRAIRALSLAEREDVSRALVTGHSIRSIAAQLGRAPSTVSREIRRNGGTDRYRASHADQAAWDRARRPKACKLALHPTLAKRVADKLQQQWSPEQIRISSRPSATRRSMISTYQLMITIGILVAFLSDAALSYTGAWRWMLGVIAIPGALFLLGVLLLPDSPRWFMMRGRREEALGVLRRLRGDEVIVLREAADIEEQLKTPQSGWHLFLGNRNFRRSVGLGVLLQLMQQFTGMNVVMYYAPRIFRRWATPRPRRCGSRHWSV